MGIWEYTSSAAEAVKRNVPDTTSLKNAYNTSYSYGSAASTKIGQVAADINGYGLSYLRHLMPDDEAKAKIGMYASIFAQNAVAYGLRDGYKLIPGGTAISTIVSETLDDVRYENLKAEKLRALGAAPPNHTRSGRKLIVGVEGRGGRGVEFGHKSPEDVIHGFMTRDYFGNRFFDDLMVTESSKRERKERPPYPASE